jgi:hypothetical protein
VRVPRYHEVWGEEMVAQVDEYLDSLYRLINEGIDAPTLTGLPFCGCPTCEFRETAYLITKLVLEGAEAGQVWLEEEAT